MESFNLNLNLNPDIYVKDVYEIIANEFDDKRQTQWDWIEDFLNQYQSGTLLYDIGCGSGRNIRPGMIGVDNCQNFLKICREKGKNVIFGEMTEIPLDTNSGNGLICIAAFHHLKTPQQRLAALKEFKRVLKKDARILISVWSIDQSHQITSKNQTPKSKLNFQYGDNLVPWTKPGKHTLMRYYYIFRQEEIENIFHDAGLNIINHFWNHGNDIYILET
jgi:tRNA (uracil-5-)-methyltransferase TRM9